MNKSIVADGIYQLSVNIEDILFEGLWEIPNGVSMNSYIVKGEKTAIIDGVIDWDGKPESLFKLLDEVGVDLKSIEYVVLNHMEPDHTGWIKDLQKIHSNFKIVCTKRAVPMLKAFFNYEGEIIVVGDGDSIDLGGRELSFAEIPNVHWPDTMATFDAQTGTLFSCDAFGSYGKVDHGNYDDLLSEEDLKYYEEEAVKYYSNIVAIYSRSVEKAIEKCASLPIKIIAPGHGIVWRENPQRIIDDYIRYAKFQQGPAKEEVTIIWGSMYGMTEKAVNHAIAILESENIKVHSHRMPQDSWGNVLASAWKSTGIIIAAPTYEGKMFPPVTAALEEIGNKKVLNRKALTFGSYGWAPGSRREIEKVNERLKMNWDFVDPIDFKGEAREDDFKAIEKGVHELIEKVREAIK